MEPSGKTLSIISRLPAFYEAEQVESLLFQLLNVFGQLLEQTDIDLLRVLRSHHITSATNEGSQGLGSRQQGDLDQIFSLYLQVLEGTSQLTQVNPQFRPGTFKDLSGLLFKLQQGSDRLSLFLQQNLSPANRDRLATIERNPLPKAGELEAISIQQGEATLIQTWEPILIEALNRCLQDSQFYARNRRSFVLDALPPVIRQLIQQAPRRGKNLAVLNRALLETAYPNEIEKSYAPYRDRLLELIRVLRRGAAPGKGIEDIVAVNLGIFSDDASARAARKQIRVEEYLPELRTYPFEIHPHSPPPDSATAAALRLEQTFSILNPNPFPTDVSLKITVRDRWRSSEIPLQPLSNCCLVNVDSGKRYEIPQTLKVDAELRILSSGEVLLKGETLASGAKVAPLTLPLKTSNWRFEASVGELVGKFDETLFDLSRFNRVDTPPLSLNRQQARNYAIHLTLEFAKLTPGAFRVRVPWHIPGFTDKFDELHDHPRTQIPAIINKVKAAGVMAIIDYEQTWTEWHELSDRLIVVRSPFTETHEIEEVNFDIASYQSPYPNGIQHELSDQLLLCGVFDYTQFDSGNHFA